MKDDFTFLIFTYHNVFHSLLASFRLRKWRFLALVPSDVDVTCVLSLRSAFPTQRRWVMMKTNFQPKIGLKQPNVLTQRSQPSIWVEKTTQRFLECSWVSQLSSFELLFSCAQLTSTEHCSSQLKSTKPKWSHLKSSHFVTSTQVDLTQVNLCYFKTSSQLKWSLLKYSHFISSPLIPSPLNFKELFTQK